jgi:hypothetical protein
VLRLISTLVVGGALLLAAGLWSEGGPADGEGLAAWMRRAAQAPRPAPVSDAAPAAPELAASAAPEPPPDPAASAAPEPPPDPAASAAPEPPPELAASAAAEPAPLEAPPAAQVEEVALASARFEPFVEAPLEAPAHADASVAGERGAAPVAAREPAPPDQDEWASLIRRMLSVQRKVSQ